ncbi:MAG: 3'(2'),5'-bisphosphate nucleotidase CysQ, partial [Erysipelotrichia bacterium]|nr:3'(2'),5'-bisphosphate nucleotidase CysQ [Erysipelotrichia bacterium]
MWEKELLAAIEAGKRASVKIMEIYRKGFDVEIKSDQSPVTEADKLADKIIYDYLRKEFPNHAFFTEESDDNLNRLKNDFVWIIDPVDGTKNFVARDDEFTTNIALAYKHEIVVGVVVVP